MASIVQPQIEAAQNINAKSAVYLYSLDKQDLTKSGMSEDAYQIIKARAEENSDLSLELENIDVNTYNANLQQAIHDFDTLVGDTNKEWNRQNYAKKAAEFTELAEEFATLTNTTAVKWDDALTYTAEESDWSKQLRADLKDRSENEQFTQEAADIFKQMTDIVHDVEIHSYVGSTNIIGANGTDYNVEATSYRAGGTDGITDELEGIGANKIDNNIADDGIGSGDFGKGIGNGSGNGIGDNSGKEESENASTAVVKKDSRANTSEDSAIVAVSDSIDDTTADYEEDAAAIYAKSIMSERAINHIFQNEFYRKPPVAHWAYSVDFIPTSEFQRTCKSVAYDIAKILTKAILIVELPSRTISSVISNFKGATIESAGRAKTSGDLKMTFAENETCIMQYYLDELLKFGRQAEYFENIDNFDTENLEQLKSLSNLINFDENHTIRLLRTYRKALLSQNGAPAHLFNILVKLYRMRDTKAFGDSNPAEYPTCVYYFKQCDLQKIFNNDFDYNNDKPVDVQCSFMYQYFEEMSYYEYALRYGSIVTEAPQKIKLNIDTNQSLQEQMNQLIDFSNSNSRLARQMFARG